MTETNRQVRLRSRPEGIPQAEHFAVVEAPLGRLAAGQFRVRNAFVSVDPAMRGWVSAVGNYSSPVGIGEVMRSFAVGEVVESRHPEYAIGERLVGMFGWQVFADSDGSNVVRRVREPDLPLAAQLGVLGMNGVTALLALTLANSPLHAQALDPILPDPRLTPGATVVIGHDALCTPGYSHGVR